MRFTFRGTIQGVGFRPAVHRLACALGLAGFVQNRSSVVIAEVQGPQDDVARFAALLASRIPPVARIERMESTPLPVVTRESGFRIRESGGDAYTFPPIPPDLPLCADCAREILDPGNRRYLYPFITCTQCGPRYSIVESTPFDRANTTMRPFTQCPDCAHEYSDPADRRFHSQTNSCPACGPRLLCADSGGRPLPGTPLESAIAALQEGRVVALQGIGGFHLAADPRHADAVARLRRMKERARKPFALMVRDLEEARAVCLLSATEEGILASPEAPIVIAPRRHDAPAWLRTVSDTETLGIMLPYTPLHLLLFMHPGLGISHGHLIMTSGNRADEPIITDPTRAMARLADVAEVFLCHDRRIAFRTDDSIVRAGPSSPPFLLRRSRGHVPRLINLAREVHGVRLALGGDLKSAPALARGADLHLSPYIGDLADTEAAARFEEQIRELLQLYSVTPDTVVRDLHPLYVSSRWRAPDGARVIPLQHHYCHALSVMAEHGMEEALALSFDGTGYGTDGTVWGGELLHATRRGFRRLGSLASFPLPGGEAAILHPGRVAYGLLGAAAGERLSGLAEAERRMLDAMIAGNVNCPACTSMGRLFDAAAAILGLVDDVSYEGEGPIRLEGKGLAAWRGNGDEHTRGLGPANRPVGWAGDAGPRLSADAAAGLLPFLPGPGDERLFLIDGRPLLARLLTDRDGEPVEDLALLFHEAVARASTEAARRMRRETGVARIALSGGVFQNLLLRELLIPLLINDGFEVFLNEESPPGDGGLAVGQAWYDEGG